ncbi:MAG TPA: hypothetical protein VIJ53_08030, partial [Acidobacteriaceae bacterium]
GEGGYDEWENWIRTLLEEANHKPLPSSATQIAASGAEAASDSGDVQSPETYVGYRCVSKSLTISGRRFAVHVFASFTSLPSLSFSPDFSQRVCE